MEPSFMAGFSAREQVLMLVGAVLFLVAFAALIQAGRLSRRLKFWLHIASLAGVRKMGELQDGEYQLEGCLDAVGDCFIWRAFFRREKGTTYTCAMTLMLPRSLELITPWFIVKDGKIIEPQG